MVKQDYYEDRFDLADSWKGIGGGCLSVDL